MTHPLRAYRETHGLTQSGLAEILECSQGFIALVEGGHRSLSKLTAEEWEKKTGIPRHALMFPDEYPSKPAGEGSHVPQ